MAAADDSGQSVAKFTIPDLGGEGVRWFDSGFYSLHDEWYWYRLLNGFAVPGLETEPVPGHSFGSIDEIYAWALERGALPLDLRFTDTDRLYSPEYYQLALFDNAKTYGLGSLIHFRANEASDRDHWVMQFEFSEQTTPETVAQYFDRLAATLPSEIADNLEWLARSPQQEQTARSMQADNANYSDRIVHYRDLVPRGQVSVYNEGVAAGRLRLISAEGDDLTDADDTDILIVENAPDFLPPASALLSSSPQTPLAHINLLARNRGIPNASVAGLLDDPAFIDAARIRAYAIVRASATDQLDITLISREQFEEWQALQNRSLIAVPPVDPLSLSTVLRLTDLAAEIDNEADVEAWRPIIGGKSAGFLALLGADGVSTPDSPLAITVAPYSEHLALVDTELDAMLANDDFRRFAPTRFLLLEGPEDFADQYPGADDAAYAEQFVNDLGPNDPVRRIIEADGFKNLFRDRSMNPSTLATIIAALETGFGGYADTQGLRFRSSSSVEDIEGFSGAGLYDSNTGFLAPEAQAADDQKKTVERTIKKTWASYWAFEAFEERRRENVDHRSGAMGVLLHARFDDPLEVNNGVATFTILPREAGSLAVINVQVGDESVTNPDPTSGDLPELIETMTATDLTITIDRIAESTLADDEPVLDDAAVRALVEQLDAVTRLWRHRVNASLPADQQIETVTLDFEFKSMAAGWPALDNSTERPARLVVKQARSLEPGLRDIPADVLALPIPRDILARAQLVDQFNCLTGTVIHVFTDPLVAPDMGYSEAPFVIDANNVGRDTSACEREILHSTPDRFLVELLESGTGLDLDQ